MSNDKPAAVWGPDAPPVHTHGPREGRGVLCPERRDAQGLVGACQAERYALAGPWTPEGDVIEPLSLADLHDLIRETSEALDTLVDHAHAARRAALGDETGPLDQVATLRDIADRLGAAWASCVSAQRATQALAAVQP